MSRAKLTSLMVVISVLISLIALLTVLAFQTWKGGAGNLSRLDDETLAIEQQFFEVALKYDDVPRKYRASGETYAVERDGGQGREHIWRAREFDPTSYIAQETLVFPDAESAIAAVEAEMRRYRRIKFDVVMPDNGENWEFNVDSISYGCAAPVRVQSGYREATAILCVTIGQYDNVTMEVAGHILGVPFLTMEEYQSLVSTILNCLRRNSANPIDEVCIDGFRQTE